MDYNFDGIDIDSIRWSKQKFKTNPKKPGKRICEMNLAEAEAIRERAFRLSNAYGYADDASRQNLWTGYENEALARIYQLTQGNENEQD